MRVASWSGSVEVPVRDLPGFVQHEGGLVAGLHAAGVEAIVGREGVELGAGVHQQHDLAGPDVERGRVEAVLVDRDRVIRREVDVARGRRRWGSSASGRPQAARSSDGAGQDR